MIGQIFNTILLQPFLNALLILYQFLGHNYFLAIAVLTIILRLITQPLMAKQLNSTKRMNDLQPQLKELEKKYGNDKERMAQEQMKLYKENGINPMAGCLPTLLQFPIWIALYQSIIQTLGRSPLQFLALSKHIYSLGIFAGLPLLVPLASKFLWLNLALPDPYYVLPILTGITMWVQQKMMTPPSTGVQANSTQAQMSQSMAVTMPLMFAFITINLASGLALYFVISNLVGIAVQYFMTGWGSLLPKRAAPVAVAVETAAPVQKGTKSGSRKKKR